METLREQLYQEKKKLERTISLVKNDKRVGKANIDTIMRFKNAMLARDRSIHTIVKYLRRLRYVAIALSKDFKKATKQDMESIFAEYHSKYSGWTPITYQAVIKSFYRWLYDLEPSDKLPKSVSWIAISKPPTSIKKEDLLSPEDIGKMLAATTNIQHKALISVIYEGALRAPGEVLTIERKHVTINEDHITINVGGKTEKKLGRRDIFLFNSYDLLVQWLNSHPLRHKLNYPLWIKRSGQIFGERYLNKLIKNVAMSAGITQVNKQNKHVGGKRVWPYLLRHSRATELYKQYGEAIAKKYMGHSPNSKMAAVYNHLCDEDVYEALSGKKKESCDVKLCPRCNHRNTYGVERCKTCGLSLNLEEATKPRLDIEQVKMVVREMLESSHGDVSSIEGV